MPLLHWQEPLCQKLEAVPHSAKLVALPTGAGKTYIATEFVARKARHQLVVCPKSVITAWSRVAADLNREAPLQVLNWEQLKTGKHRWWDVREQRWRLPPDTVVTIDEIHKGASGPDSQITKMVAMLKAYPVEVMMLSATPATSPLGMRAIGYLFDQHPFKEPEFYAWCRANGCWFDRFVRRWRFAGGAAGREHMKRLNERIKDRMLWMDLKDIPGFPESQTVSRLFNLDARHVEAIDRIYSEMSDEIRTGELHSNPMVAMLRARQKTELVKVPLLADLVEEAVDEDKSPVVFVSFKDTVHGLAAELKKRGIASNLIHGDQNANERQAAIDTFQANLVHVMIATSQAGGVGISLHDVQQERQRVSFITPSFSASDMKQCLGRIHRAGGTNVIQTFVLIAGTIEENIHRAISGKFQNLEALLEDSDLTG